MSNNTIEVVKKYADNENNENFGIFFLDKEAKKSKIRARTAKIDG